MILRDTVTVLRRMLTGTDEYGNDVHEDSATPYAAEAPAGIGRDGGGPYAGRDPLPSVLACLSGYPEPSDAVTWRGVTLELQGDIELHTLGRSMHHVEVIAARVSGLPPRRGVKVTRRPRRGPFGSYGSEHRTSLRRPASAADDAPVPGYCRGIVTSSAAPVRTSTVDRLVRRKSENYQRLPTLRAVIRAVNGNSQRLPFMRGQFRFNV